MTLLADTMVPVDAIMLDKYQVTIQSGKTVKNGLPATQMLQKATGTSVITARTHNAVITVFTVRVVPAESSALSIDKLSVSINPGEKEQLEAIFTPQSEDDKVIWKSDNTDVAITAKKSGTVYATCEVVVITPVTGVEIDKTRLEIKVGYNEKLTATASYKGITWISSDESIVRVSQSGEVTAVSIGTAVVTASSIYNPSLKAVCTVKVIPVNKT